MAYVDWNGPNVIFNEDVTKAMKHREWFVVPESGQTSEAALAAIDTSDALIGSLAYVSGDGVYSWDGTNFNAE